MESKELKELKEEIYRKVGEQYFVERCNHVLMADETGCPFHIHRREIRLSDVLLAIKENPRGLQYQILLDVILADGGTLKTKPLWNLRVDNLDHQPIKTTNFLYELLCNYKTK